MRKSNYQPADPRGDRKQDLPRQEAGFVVRKNQINKGYRPYDPDRYEDGLDWALENEIVHQYKPRFQKLPYILATVCGLLLLAVILTLIFKQPHPYQKLQAAIRQSRDQAMTTVATTAVTTTGESQTSAPSQTHPSQGQAANAAKPAGAKGDYQYYIEPGSFDVKPVDGAESKLVLFTFDDAPDTYAVDMAKYLKSQGVPAIFLVNGHFLETPEQKARLKEISDLGFEIGNHTMTHPHLLELSPEEQKEEILGVNRLVEEITGKKVKFFRPPFGEFDDHITEICHEAGMILMGWSFGYDWMEEYQDPDKLAEIMLTTEYLRPGVNLLMHDREWTYKALPKLIEGYRAQGYGFADPDTIMPYAVAKEYRESQGLD